MSKKIQETPETGLDGINDSLTAMTQKAVSYTHLRAHETSV